MKDNDSFKPSQDNNLTEAEQKEKEEIIKEISEEIKQAENADNSTDDENPEWDGSEAEFVEDDSSAEYEIPETGIKLSYSLTRDEMYKCLYHGDTFKTKSTKAIMQSIILAAAAVIFFVTYFIADSTYNTYNLFFGIVCLVMISVIWIVPRFYLKSMAGMMADGKTVEVEIYPTHIDIGRDDGAWSVELDGTSKIEEFDGIFMIYTEKNRSFAIPQRVIDPEVYNEIKAILLSGTIPI